MPDFMTHIYRAPNGHRFKIKSLAKDQEWGIMFGLELVGQEDQELTWVSISAVRCFQKEANNGTP